MAYRVWKKEEILALVETNDEMVKRSLLKLYERQTESEQASEDVHVNNGMGFRCCDALFLTSVAKSVLQYGNLTAKQLPFVRKCLMHYGTQLTKIANGAL